MAFTYTLADLTKTDAAGDLANLRLLIPDTQDTATNPHVFEDEELRAFLAATGNDRFEAAALAYEVWAADQGRVAELMRRDGFEQRQHAIRWLLDLAESKRQAKLKGSLQTGSITSSQSGDYLEDHRPQWRRYTDAPVAE